MITDGPYRLIRHPSYAGLFATRKRLLPFIW